MRHLQIAVLFTLLCLFSTLSRAETTPPLILQESISSYEIAPFMDVLADPEGKLTLDQVRANHDEKFQRNTEKVFGDSGAESHSYYYWLRFRLVSEVSKPFLADTWLIDIDRPLLQEVNFFVISSLNEVQSHIGGNIYPFSNRMIQNVNHVYPLTVLPGEEVQVFIRVHARGPLLVPMTLWSEAAFIEHESDSSFWAGAFYGVLIIMIFYNLFVYFTTRDVAYLYYVIFVSVLSITLATLDGYSYKFLWPSWPTWNTQMVYVGTALSVLSCLRFMKAFLQLGPEFHPTLGKIYDRFFQASLLLLPTQFLLNNWLLATIDASAYLVVMSFNLIACAYLATKNSRIAIFGLLAWCLPILGVLIYLLSILAIIPAPGSAEFWFKLGFVAQTAIFSAALADKINVVRKDNAGLQEASLINEKESNRLKDEFMATISHELRTPMNGVQGALELVKLADGLPEDVVEYVKIAEQSSENMMELIQGILDFTEIQSGRVKVVEERFCLHDAISSMHNKFLPKAADKNIEFSLIYGGIHKDVWVEADINKIAYILDRLVDNAIKFTEKGRIDLKVIANQMSQGSLWMTFEVEDTGVGISKSNQKKMFDAFQQVDGTFSRRFGGLGIGLALSNKFADLLGTRLELESVEGRGTRFWFSLPIKVVQPVEDQFVPKGADAKPQELNQKSDVIPNYCILIVEDNRVNQVVLRKLIEKFGYEVRTAVNGEQALEVLDRDKISLILMDCQMPVMDGFEATRVIRNKNWNYSKIPIIAVTANVSAEDEAHCYAVGMNDFVKKPFDKKIIERKLKQWL